MDWLKMLQDLVPLIGQKAVDELVGKLEELAGDAGEAWQKAILALFGDALEKHGVEGIQMAMDALTALLDKNEAPQIDWADLKTASDILAELQNAEADRKTAAKAFMTKVSHTLGTLMGGMIKGLIASA